MFDTITRKEFISILRTGENEIIYTNLNLLDASCTKIMRLLYSGNFNVTNGRRCTAASQKQATFSDGSKVTFESNQKYYKHNNIIISYREMYDTFDEAFRYAIIAYVVK